MKDIDQKGFSMLDILLSVALAAVIVAAGYFAYQNALTKTVAGTSSKSASLASPSDSPGIPNGSVKFTHTTAGYSLLYPKDWKGGQVAHPGVEIDVFHIESPDRKEASQYPLLEQGAELTVNAEKTNKTLDEAYNSNQIGATVNRNKISTKVAGQPAFQYDWAYEQINATSTMFVKDGVLYTVTFRYVDEKGKQAFWSDYTQLLASFKLE